MAGAASSGGGGSAVKAGEAFVEIAAKTTGFDKAIAALQKRMKSVGTAMAKVGAGIAAAGASAAVPLISLFTAAVEKGSGLNDLADRLGTTTETISALGYAAEQSGVGMESLEGALGKMQKAISEGGSVGELDLGSLAGKDLEEQAAAVAEAIDGIGNAEDRTAAAMQVFGKSGRDLLPMLKGGSAGLKTLTDEARELGYEYNHLDGEQADKIGDATHKLWKSLGSLQGAVGKAILPLADEISTFADAVARAVIPLRQFIKANSSVIVTVAAVGVGLMAIGSVIAGVGVAFVAASAALGAIVAVFGFILSPLGLITAGVIALGIGLAMAIRDGTDFGASLSEAFGGVKDAILGGEWGLAADIAMTGVRLEFEKAVAGLKGVWLEFKNFFAGVWDGMVAAARIAVAEIFKAVQSLVGNSVFRALVNASMPGSALKVLANVDLGEVLTDFSTHDHVGDANAKDRARADELKKNLAAVDEETRKKLAAIQEVQDAQLSAATDARLNAELLAAEQAAARGIGMAADQAGTSAGTVKGAFASQAGAGSFAFADAGKDIAKNTKRTADGVEDLARVIDRNQLVVSA
jgi:hypothetical protein